MLDSVRAGEEFERVSGRVYEASNKEDVLQEGHLQPRSGQAACLGIALCTWAHEDDTSLFLHSPCQRLCTCSVVPLSERLVH